MPGLYREHVPREESVVSAEVRWHVLPDAAAVAEAAAERILSAASQAIAARGRFRIVLAGGSTPRATYRLLRNADTDWRLWEVYFGDERCLPPDHPERNSRMAQAVWLDHVSVPAGRIHPIPAEQGPEAAARAYEALVRSVVPFDLVLLGLGEDGHTASLFPGLEWSQDAWVVAVHGAPKPPPERVSLGPRALGDSHGVLVLVTGAGKRAAVEQWRSGADLPVAHVQPATGVDVLLDRAAGETRCGNR